MFLQKFKKESKQFGAQRRASEETIKPLDWKNFFIFYIHSFFAVI